MMTTYNNTTSFDESVHVSKAEKPSVASPFYWLRHGWNDVTGAPMTSALLGGIFTVLCAAGYAAASTLPMFSASVLTLLLFASPFIAAIAYSIARQREHNLAPSVRVGISDIRSRVLSIGLFSILSALIVAAWVRISSIAFALYYGTLGTDAAEVARTWTAGNEAPAMLIFIASTGLVLATVLFAIGAIALPLISDRNHNVISAVNFSLQTLRNNPLTMIVWALLIVALIAIAILSSLLLMPIVFPLLAFATWHSYRQLTESKSTYRH
jgi:uncharacterized membrane protein